MGRLQERVHEVMQLGQSRRARGWPGGKATLQGLPQSGALAREGVLQRALQQPLHLVTDL